MIRRILCASVALWAGFSQDVVGMEKQTQLVPCTQAETDVFRSGHKVASDKFRQMRTHYMAGRNTFALMHARGLYNTLLGLTNARTRSPRIDTMPLTILRGRILVGVVDVMANAGNVDDIIKCNNLIILSNTDGIDYSLKQYLRNTVVTKIMKAATDEEEGVDKRVVSRLLAIAYDHHKPDTILTIMPFFEKMIDGSVSVNDFRYAKSLQMYALTQIRYGSDRCNDKLSTYTIRQRENRAIYIARGISAYEITPSIAMYSLGAIFMGEKRKADDVLAVLKENEKRKCEAAGTSMDKKWKPNCHELYRFFSDYWSRCEFDRWIDIVSNMESCFMVNFFESFFRKGDLCDIRNNAKLSLELFELKQFIPYVTMRVLAALVQKGRNEDSIDMVSLIPSFDHLWDTQRDDTLNLIGKSILEDANADACIIRLDKVFYKKFYQRNIGSLKKNYTNGLFSEIFVGFVWREEEKLGYAPQWLKDYLSKLLHD